MGSQEQAIPLGPFALEARIGAGGMGEVWRGYHRAGRVPVAVKVITAGAARDPDVLAAFRNEVRAVARLDHPGIVRVLEYGMVSEEAAASSAGRLVDGSPFLAMELLTAGVLDTEQAPFDWYDLRETLLALLDALAHAHARGLIHRDLKPRNILFAGPDNDRPGLRLTDFGIAHALDVEDDSRDGAMAGTPWYMAPEQHHNAWRDYGPWTDLYALGCIAWELASGVRPFPGRDLFSVVWGHLNTEPGELHARIPVPSAFDDWVRRLLEKDPADRFERAADAAFALRELEERQVWGAPPLPGTWRAPSDQTRSALRLGGAGLGLHGLRSLPVLGREQQLDAIWTALREVWATAASRVILLHGAAGCGKSRIAEFMCERAEEVGGASTLRVVHDPKGGSSTGLAAMVASALHCGGLNRSEVVDRLETLLRADGVTDPYEWRALTEFLAPPEDWLGAEADQVVRFQDPTERNALVQRFLYRRATRRPVILWVDDVQWGSPALSLAEHLLRAPPASVGPVLMLLTVRDDALRERPIEARRVEELMQLERTSRVEITRLGEAHCRELVRDVLGLEGALAEAVETQSAGNPLFAVQLVGDWVRRGLLVPGQEGFRLRGKGALPAMQLPGDIHEIWTDRIARAVEGHGEDATRTLELAAALGLSINAFEWNHACSHAELRADPALIDTLMTDGLADDTETGWTFSSELLREALERAARVAGRWEAHNASCVAMLETRYPERPSGLARRLGTHLVEAGRLAEGVETLGEAAWELVDSNEYRDALQVVTSREAGLRQLRVPAGDPRWGECLLVRCGAKMHLGQLEEALEDARKAEVEAARHDWPTVLARALGQQGILARLAGNAAEAIERWQEALTLCVEDDRGTRARLLYYLASVRRQECDFEAASALYNQALDLYGLEGNQLGEAQCLHGLGTIAQDTGDLDTAERVFGELVPLFVRTGNRFGLSQARNGLAAVAHLRGNLDEACAGYQEAWDLLESIGSPAAIVTGLNVALIHALRRDLDALGSTLHRIESRRAAAAQRPWLGQLLIYRLPLLAGRQDWASWDQTLARARELLTERAGAPQDIATAARIAGDLAVERGQTERGRVAYMVAREQWELLDEQAGITVIDGLLSRLPRA